LRFWQCFVSVRYSSNTLFGLLTFAEDGLKVPEHSHFGEFCGVCYRVDIQKAHPCVIPPVLSNCASKLAYMRLFSRRLQKKMKARPYVLYAYTQTEYCFVADQF